MTRTSLYIQMTPECGKASNEVHATLTDEEKSDIQRIVSRGYKVARVLGLPERLIGTWCVEDCDLTRRMFAGHCEIM